MPFQLILLMMGVMALLKATALWSMPAPSLQKAPTYQPDCTYNREVKFCVVRLPEDPSTEPNHTLLIHWLDGDITSVWFLSGGSTETGARVILNHNKRGRISQAVPLEEGGHRLHVKSETGNQLSFIVPSPYSAPGADADPRQP